MDIAFNQIGAFNGIEGGPKVITNPTSLAFGPDGRLYVSEQNGTINAFTLILDDGEYKATSHETLTLASGAEVVKSIQNHNDDGVDSALTNRQVTGLLVTGTAENPILYISSSDPRIANNGEADLDTNSGVVTQVTFNGTDWEAVDIIRGLPRSEENHATNGLALSADGGTLFVQSGGNTNNGAPSAFFSYTGEYALSGALLAVDLADIASRPVLVDPVGGQGGVPRNYVYDLPTLDDPNIANDGVSETVDGLDIDGPWGGNDGLNQAILPADAPISIYADGFRNPYDIVVTDDGRLYTVDNGSNGGLGGSPVTDGDGAATQAPNNGGTGDGEPLFKIEEGGYYGHANPTRSNQDLEWTVYDDNGDPDAAVPVNNVPDLSALVPDAIDIQDGFIIDPSRFTGDPTRLAESGVRVPHDDPNSESLAVLGSSSNGLVEYKGDAFGGAIDGALVVTQFNGNLTLLNLNEAGTALEPLTNSDGDVVDDDGIFSLANGLQAPLDVTMGPDGTLFVAEIGGDSIKVFAPTDLVLPDDPDFDNDGLLNTVDAFLRDASNGSGVLIQPGQNYVWDFDPDQDGNRPGPDGYGGGLTGVMVDGTTDFEQFFQDPSDLPAQIIKLDNVKFITAAGGGTTVIENVSNGDPFLGSNSGEYLFHTGVTVAPTVETFTVKWTLFNPVDQITGAFQQVGGYIGTGDQSNYLKVVAIQTSDNEAGIQLSLENNDLIGANTYTIPANDIFDPAIIPDNAKIFIELLVDPVAQTATPTVTFETVSGDQTVTGTAISLAGSNVLDAINGDFTIEGQTSGLAVGLFSTNNGEPSASTFQAIFDEIEINATGDETATTIYRVNAGGPTVAAIDGGLDWSADTPTANNPNLSDAGSNNASEFPAVDPGATVPGAVPGALFDTERWDQPGGTEMSYSFDVSQSGFYEVRLFMGNGFAGTSAPGARVFDVSIEGAVPTNLDDVDLSTRFGHLVGGMITNVVEVTDGSLDIEFLHVVENPLVNAIEIVQLGAVSDLTVSIINGPIEVAEDDGLAQVSIATNTTVPSDETVTVTFEVTSGTATAGTDFVVPGAMFDATAQTYSGSVIIVGNSSDVTIPIDITDDALAETLETFNVQITGVSSNAAIGTGAAQISIADNDITAGTVLYRVNAGGEEVAATDGGPTWSADTQASNSPFLINPGSNSDFPTNGQPQSGLDTSQTDPFFVPEAVLGVERFDTAADANGNMAYAFDVPAGAEVEVRLYLAELFVDIADSDTSGDPTGDRVFSVSVDGTVPSEFSDIDQYALAGSFSASSVVTARVISDGKIDLEFLAGVENPAIKGIEIVQVGSDPVDSVDGVTVPGGDLSSDPSVPTTITLEEGGATTVVSNLAGGNQDRDFITVEIPEGFRLADLTLAGYDADLGNSGFIGLVGGSNFDIDPAIPTLGVTPDGVVEPGDLLGGFVFNDSAVGNDLLPSLNNPSAGFQGFEEDNLTGTLTFWLNQGGNPSSAELAFVTEALPADGAVVAAINAGGPALTQDGINFSADEGFLNGSTFTDGATFDVNNGNGAQPAFDGSVYKTERFGGADGGTLSYEIALDPGSYEVELYFAEIFLSAPGERVFDVSVEGQIVLDDFDVLAETAGDISQPVTITLPDAVSPDAFGNPDAIDIDISASSDNGKLSGIVIREATGPTEIGEAQFSVTAESDDVQISNFGAGSFQITNTGDKIITNIEIDVTNALYPDSVFDPFGVAGDTISKALTIDVGSSTGVVDPSSYDPYVGDGGIAGFKGLSLIFDTDIDGGFQTGETVSFAVDMDPNSIAGSTKSTLDSGTDPIWDVGGVSGAELIGSTYTITFEDGTTATGQLSGAGNQGGSIGIATQDSDDLVATLTVNDVAAGDLGTYSDGGPSVVIEGPAGTTARVVLTKGIIQPVDNNFSGPFAAQLDAQLAALAASDFPANNAAEFQTIDIALTGAPQDISGLFNFADVTGFDLPFAEDQLPLGFTATIIDPDNGELPLGPVSAPTYLIYAENQAPSIDPIADIEIAEFETASFNVAAVDPEGDTVAFSEAVTRDIDGSVIDPAEYTFADNGDGTAAFNWVTDEPDEGAYTISVTADDGQSQTTETLSLIVNEIADPTEAVLYRINVGGAEVAAANGSKAWAEDTNDNPSAFRISGSNGAPTTSANIDISDASIPDAAPEAIFQSERFDFDGGAPMAWAFDVDAGTDVRINLYFAETFGGLPDADGSGDPAGDRIFDIAVDGAVPAVFDDIDQYSLAGGSFNTGFVLSHETTSDGTIDLSFLHQGFENTTIKAIEIIEMGEDDVTAPSAMLTATDVAMPGTNYTFSVEYSDDTGVDVSSLDDLDVTVSGPGGSFAAAASLVSVDVPADGAVRTATYAITPPSGSWTPADNGNYTISLNDGEISDIIGNSADGAVIGSFIVNVEATDQVTGGRLDVAVTPGTDLDASTFEQGSFSLTNASDAGVDIASVMFDLSTGILPDMVFDPTGAGGDETASPFTPNSGAAATGLVLTGDPAADPFSDPRNGGFDKLTIDFTDFNPGETFTFTTDVDPNSIQDVPGAGAAGSVSGYELIGSTITVTFTDGISTEVSVASLFEEGSLGGSATQVTSEDAVAAPTLSILGSDGDLVPSLPGDQFNVTDTDFTVQLTGTPGAGFELLQMDTRLFIATGAAPFDVSADELPFYANEAMEEQVIFTGTFDAAGQAVVPASLLETQGAGDTPDGGLNYFMARTIVDGEVSVTSAPLVVQQGSALVYNEPGVMTFSGTNADVIELPHDPVYEIPEGTIAFSFNTTSVASDQGLFTKDASFFVGGGNHLVIYLDNSVLKARFQSATESVTFQFAGITPDTEYEVAATFSADGVELWVDGNLVDSDALVMDWTQNVQALQWGGRGWGSSSGALGFDAPFSGTISDKQIYSEPLTASQIASLAARSSGSNTPPTAVDDAVSVVEDGSINIDVLTNDSDADGDIVSLAGVITAPTNGTAVAEADGTVTYTPDPDFNGPDSFEISVTDASGGTSTSTVTVTVDPVNDDPTAVDDTATTILETSVTVDVLANDTDVDGDTLDVSAVTDGANGTVAINADGTVTYAPDAGFVGDDSFTYTIDDQNGGAADTATVSVTVLGAPNVDPVAVADAVSVDEDGTITFQPGDNDTDGNGDIVTASSIAAGPANGFAIVNPDGTVSYTPIGDFNGIDMFDVTVSDGNGGFDTATTTVTVNPVNDDPMASDDNASATGEDPVTINLLANDSDVDGDTLTILSVGVAANGTIVNNGDGTVTYSANAGFEGSDTFTYTIGDGAETSQATVTVDVTTFPTPIFDMPAATLFNGSNAGVLELPHDPIYEIPEGTVNFAFTPTDTSGSQGLFVKDASGFVGGGNHLAIYLQGDDLIVRVQDGTNSVSLNVANITAGQTYDLALTFGVSGAQVYLDGALVASDPLQMDWTQNVEFIQFGGRGWASASGASGFDSPFEGLIADKQIYDVALSADQVLALHSDGPVNGAPNAIDDAISVVEDGSVTFDPTANDTDPENDPLMVEAVVLTPANGTATVNVDGTVTYAPDPDFVGTDAFDVLVEDDTGGFDISTVMVTISPLDDDPEAVDDTATTLQGQPVIISVLDNDTDIDGDTISVVGNGVASNGTVVDNGDNTFTYTPDAGFLGTDTFEYTISDGDGPTDTAMVAINVSEEASGPSDPVFELAGITTFNGSGASVVNLPPSSDLEIEAGTIAFSFIADDFGGRQGLLTKDASGFVGGGNHFAAYVENDDIKVRFQDGADSDVFVFNNIVEGQEYEFAATFSADGVGFYVDGALIGSSDLVMDWRTNVEFLQVGGLGWGSASGAGQFRDPFEGQIADVEIYDAVLDPFDVQTLASTSSFDAL